VLSKVLGLREKNITKILSKSNHNDCSPYYCVLCALLYTVWSVDGVNRQYCCMCCNTAAQTKLTQQRRQNNNNIAEIIIHEPIQSNIINDYDNDYEYKWISTVSNINLYILNPIIYSGSFNILIFKQWSQLRCTHTPTIGLLRSSCHRS